MKKLNTELFIIKAREVHGNVYNYDKVEYIKAITKVIIVCPIHGDFSQRPNDHISGGNGCPKCKSVKNGNLKRKDQNDLIIKFEEVHGNVFDYKEVIYVNNKTPITVLCSSHGPFNIIPSKHLAGNGCPLCTGSYGERTITAILTELNVQFETEKTFDNLSGDYLPLKFDFYLPDHNLLIEYDGEFHFFHHKIFNYKQITEVS